MDMNLRVSEGCDRRPDEPNAMAHTPKSEFLGQVAG
jgi:hypothetical protein